MNKYVRNKNIVERKIHDAFYLIDITDNYLDEKCRLYEINEMGDVIWNQIDISSTASSQIDYLTDYIKELIIDDVSEDVIKNDIKAFFDSMIAEGFLEVVNSGRIES